MLEIRKQVQVAELDMNDTVFFEGEVEKVLDFIKSAEIYHPDLLYRGFDGHRIPYVKRCGVDVPLTQPIYMANEIELREEAANGTQSPLKYAQDHSQPALSVYKPDFLECTAANEYRFKSETDAFESLIVVLKLLNYQPPFYKSFNNSGSLLIK